MLNEDYKEMLQILLNNNVEFLVIGAYALGAYGYPRATGDFDIWVNSTEENSKKLYKSLLDFGTPIAEINETTFNDDNIVFQIGVAPRRIDIITHIDGVIFKDAYKTRELIEVENINIPFLSKENLIKNKQSTGRQKDKLDVEYLKRNNQ